VTLSNSFLGVKFHNGLSPNPKKIDLYFTSIQLSIVTSRYLIGFDILHKSEKEIRRGKKSHSDSLRG
jgi:hypothetical protein